MPRSIRLTLLAPLLVAAAFAWASPVAEPDVDNAPNAAPALARVGGATLKGAIEAPPNPCECPPNMGCLPSARVGFVRPEPQSAHPRGLPLEVEVFGCDLWAAGGDGIYTSVECPTLTTGSFNTSFAFTPPAVGTCRLTVYGGAVPMSLDKAAKSVSSSIDVTIVDPAPPTGTVAIVSPAAGSTHDGRDVLNVEVETGGLANVVPRAWLDCAGNLDEPDARTQVSATRHAFSFSAVPGRQCNARASAVTGSGARIDANPVALTLTQPGEWPCSDGSRLKVEIHQPFAGQQFMPVGGARPIQVRALVCGQVPQGDRVDEVRARIACDGAAPIEQAVTSAAGFANGFVPINFAQPTIVGSCTVTVGHGLASGIDSPMSDPVRFFAGGTELFVQAPAPGRIVTSGESVTVRAAYAAGGTIEFVGGTPPAVIGSDSQAPYEIVRQGGTPGKEWTEIRALVGNGAYRRVDTVWTTVAAPRVGRLGPATAAPCAIGAASCAAITNPLVFYGSEAPAFWVRVASERAIRDVRFRLNGVDLGAAQRIGADIYAMTTPRQAPSASPHSIVAVATDEGGVSTSTAPTVFFQRTVPPSVVLEAPTPGARFTQGVAVSARAVPTVDGTPAGVEFFRNGASVVVDNSPPYAHVFGGLPVGEHVIQARVIDAIGATALSAPVSVTVVANQPPSVQITSPGNGARALGGAALTLTAAASDPDGQVSSVQFFARTLPSGVEQSIATDNTAPFSITWTGTAAFVAPQVQIRAVATDDLGRPAEASIVIGIDPNQPPTVSLVSPATEAQPFLSAYRWNQNIYAIGQTLRLQANVQDANLNVQRVEFRRRSFGADGGSPTEHLLGTVPASSGAQASFTLDRPVDTSWFTGGLHQIYATAVDALGASTTSQTAPIAVVPAPPTIAGCVPPTDFYEFAARCSGTPGRHPFPTAASPLAFIEAERYDMGGQLNGQPSGHRGWHGVGYFKARPRARASEPVMGRSDEMVILAGTPVAPGQGTLTSNAYLSDLRTADRLKYAVRVTETGRYSIGQCSRSRLLSVVASDPKSQLADSADAAVQLFDARTGAEIASVRVDPDERLAQVKSLGARKGSAAPCPLDAGTGGSWTQLHLSDWDLPAGDYEMFVHVVDRQSTLPPSQHAAWEIDLDRFVIVRTDLSAAARVELLSPVNGAIFDPATTIPLRAELGGAPTQVRYERSLPGSGVWTQIGGAPVGPRFESSIVAGTLGIGSHQLRVCAVYPVSTVCSTTNVVIQVVANGNIPPTVRITAPSNGRQFAVGETLGLEAEANDVAPGSVNVVEFLLSGSVPAQVLPAVNANGVWRANWTPASPGDVLVVARARDDQGAVSVSATSSYSVQVGASLAAAAPPSYANVPAGDPSSDVVAATQGQFRVDESGAATYAIPLAMAPGLAGVVPQLSLNYSSGGGEGMLGVGWSVSGLQAISRCRKSIEAGDAFAVANTGNTEVTELGHKPLRFFPASGAIDPDQFCLDGQRLLRIEDAGSAAHGTVGARYRTEIDDFSDVSIVDDGDATSINAGPEQFRVERKDGSVLTFGGLSARNTSGQSVGTNARLPVNVASGATASTLRIESGRGAIMTWALSRTEDRLGNAIHYVYEYPGGDPAAGEQYIKEIHYTVPGAGSAQSPRARVVFDYAAVAVDVSFVSGMKLQRSRRLSRIDVFNDSQLVRSYRLDYDGAASMSNRDRLRSIQECADAAGAVCYPRTRFEWTDGVPGVSSSAATSVPNEVHAVQPPGGGEPAPHAIKYGDLNGDGLTDLVWARNVPDSEDQVVCWAIAQATGFGFASDCNNGMKLYQRRETDGNLYTVASSLAFHLYDFSGDGRDDLLIAEKDDTAWSIYVSDGTGFSATSAPRSSAKSAGISLGGTGEAQLADFNGDGLLDAVYGVGAGTGGVGGGGSGGSGPCPRCLPNRPAEASPTTSAATSTVFRGLSDPASGVRPVISYMATAGIGGVVCSSGLKYCFSQTGTVGGLAATSLPAMVGHNTACGTASNQQNALGAAVRFDGGIEVLDFDGDGVNDLVAKAVPGQACASSVASAWVVYRNVGWAFDPNNPGAGARHTFARVFAQNVGGGDSNGAPNIDTGAQIGWRPVQTNDHRFVTGDLNGDGLTDLLYRGRSTGDLTTWYYRLNTGRVRGATLPGGQPADGLVLDFAPAIALPALSASGVAEKTVTLGDLTGDGAAEVVFGVDVGPSNDGYREYRALSWNGTGFEPAPIVLANVRSSRGQNSERSVFVDLDGDGRPEQVVADYEDHTPGNGEIILRRSLPGIEGTTSRRHLPLDHVHRIVDGFGAATSIRYSPLTVLGTYLPGRSSAGRAAEFGRGSNVFDLRHAQYVVRVVASSAPRFEDPSAVSRVAYRYRGARMQMGGRGFLGFEEVQTLDLQSLVEASTTYGQSFPSIGLPTATWSRALDPGTFGGSGWGTGTGTNVSLACADNPAGVSCFGFRDDTPASRSWPAAPVSAGLMMSESTDRFGFVARAAGGYPGSVNTAVSATLPPPSASPAPLFRFKVSSETSTYDLGPQKTQIEELRNETYDAHGNALRLVARRKDGAGTTLREAVTENAYGSGTTHQRFGRLSGTTVTTTAGGQSKVRRVAFRYHEPSLLLRGEVVEPTGAADRALVTTHQYNEFGNNVASATCSAHHLAGAVSNGSVAVDTAVEQCAQTSAANVVFGGSDLVVRRYARTTFAANDPRYVASEQAPFATTGTAATEQTVSTVVARDRFGNPTEVSELNGLRTRFGYDAFGAKYFESTNAGTSTRTIRRFCSAPFDGNAARWGATVPPQVAACPAGAVVRVDTVSAGAPAQTMFLDVLGREQRSVTQGFRTNQFVVSDTRYDEMGRVARKSVPVILSGALDTVLPAYFAQTYYDVAGRVVRLVTPDGSAAGGQAETTTSYSGLTTTVTMPVNVSGLRATREERRNALGEIIQSKDGTGLRACYAYDAHGNLSHVWRNETADCPATPPATVLTSVDYDDLGRKTRMVDQDKGTWRYAYNAAGEVIREITARNQCVEYRYDARGRVVSRTDRTLGTTPDTACGGTIESESTWRYDTAANGFGQPASEQASTTDPLDGSNTLQLLQDKTFAYDGFGRARSTVTRMLPNTGAARSYTSARTYDEYGRLFQDLLTSPEFPASGALYEYTDSFPAGAPDDDPNLAEGHLRKVRDATGQRRGLAWHETVNVDAFGTVIEERRGESEVLRTLRTTDDRTGRLATIRTNGGQLQNWNVLWDGAGNVRLRSNSAAGASPAESFSYDAANRLLGVTASIGGSTESYAYSATGNLTARAGGTLHYGGSRPAACQALPAPGPHAANAYVLGANTVCYTYDASGNQVSAAGGGMTRSVAYSVADQARRMDSTIDNLGSRLAFEYGAGRERIRRRDYPTVSSTTPGSETHYVGGAEVVLTPGNNCGSTRNVLVRREYSGAVLLQRSTCVSNVSTPATSLAYRLVDHLGSTDAMVTSAGLPVDSPAQQRFDAFGARRDATTWSRLARPSAVTFNTATTRRGFTGHEQLDAAGLVHMNGRVYDPEIGRFVQADPIIQAPYNPQSLNRYSYVMNNPLGTTDPTGYVGRPKWLNYAMQAVALYVTLQTGLEVNSLLISAELYGSNFAAQAVLAAAGGGAAAGMASTGSPKGALMGAATSLAYLGVGQLATTAGFASDSLGRAAMHGATGGILSELQGGSFGHGFVQAGLGKALHSRVETGSLPDDILVAAVIGGSLDEALGGKFSNGAVSAAMQWAFNACIQGACDTNLEQTLYDWMPGYKFGTWVGNRISGRSMGTWLEAAEGVVDLVPQGKAARALSIVDDARDAAKAVRPGQSGTYGELRRLRRNHGQTEQIHLDHQPSFAAQVFAREAALGRPLSTKELSQLRASTPAVASPAEVHRGTSPTYGGRNTPARIAEDAADLGRAAIRDRAVFDDAMRSR